MRSLGALVARSEFLRVEAFIGTRQLAEQSARPNVGLFSSVAITQILQKLSDTPPDSHAHVLLRAAPDLLL